MTHILGFLLALLIATASGFGLTWLAVERGHGFGGIVAGSWSAWPYAGSPDADPYAKAVLARTGEVPLGPGEGLVFEASRDDQGQPLDAHCVYHIAGNLPPARVWTLTAYDRDGRYRDNAAQRYSVTSSEIIRDADGSIDIALGAEVQPGNWLPIASDQSIILLLRLYDTPLSAGAARLETGSVPSIVRGACR